MYSIYMILLLSFAHLCKKMVKQKKKIEQTKQVIWPKKIVDSNSKNNWR